MCNLIREALPDLPSFKKSAFLKLIHCLGFRFRCRTMSSKTFLINDRRIIEWRRRFSTVFQKIIDDGKLDTVFWLDESYVHQVRFFPLFFKKKANCQPFLQFHSLKKTWEDSSIKSVADAENRGLTTGIKPPASTKGTRIIILHIGSMSGWVPDVGRIFIRGQNNPQYSMYPFLYFSLC